MRANRFRPSTFAPAPLVDRIGEPPAEVQVVDERTGDVIFVGGFEEAREIADADDRLAIIPRSPIEPSPTGSNGDARQQL